MIEPLVSIIIPIYNTEKYISKAIESVLTQTYKNFELILVDDGSEDNSGKICDSYAKKDYRIIVIHQKNLGVANARNTGLSKARGELIQFLDSDDEMYETKTETLVKVIQDNDVDIVFGGCAIRGIIEKTYCSKEAVYGLSEFLYNAYGNETLMLLISSSCTCILKRSIIMDNSINFNNDFLQGEDGLFILKYLSYTRKIYVMEVILYQYNRYALSDRVSITSCITKDVYILFIKYFKELIKIIEPSLNENEKKKLSQNFFDRLIPSLITLVIYSETSSKEIIKELKNIINIDVVQQASKKYKRHNRKHSIFIPLFIRAKLPKLLYYTLNVRVKRHQKLYGKSKYVNSIFWNKNGGIEVV